MTLKMAIAGALINASLACAAGEYELSMRAVEKGNVIVSSADVLFKRYSDVALAGNGILSNSAMSRLARRQAANNATGPQQFDSTVRLNPDGTIDMEAWDAETDAACQDALSRLPQSTNPSGTCICYNLPSLDTSTGVFEADLRVYKLNDPSGAFAGIAPTNIEVGLMYNGASVSPVEQETAGRAAVGRRQDAGAAPAAGDANPAAAAPATPSGTAAVADPAATGTAGANGNVTANLPMLQHYLFVGQIDSDRMSRDMTMAQFEALVMPVLTLTAINATGGTVSTNVSSNEAVFVTGVFSREVVMSDFALASAAVEFSRQQLEVEKNLAFVLPGIRLMVYPIGLIVTSVWLVAGLMAYGIGTYDRMGYAQSYRRRMAAANSSVKRI